MKINIARTSRIYSEVGPYLPLSETDLAKLSDGFTTISGVSIPSGSSLGIVCDLGARYNIDSVYYYRSSSVSEQVFLYARQNTSDSWESISYVSESSRVYSILATSINKYRFFRIIHTVSTSPVFAFELEVYSNDAVVQYELDSGQDLSIDSGTTTLTPSAVPIINNDIYDHEFYILLDNEGDSEHLEISTNLLGTYYGIRENSITLPDDYSFSSGSFQNTSVVDNAVICSSTTGFYYTPVIDTQTLVGRRFFWEITNSGTGEVDNSASIDNLPTVSIRNYDQSPTDLGWVPGNLSTDSNWSIVSGTIPFLPVVNSLILDYNSKRYFQAKVEFSKPGSISPALTRIGVEGSIQVSIPAGGTESVYVRSTSSDHIDGRSGGIISWFFQDRSVD